MSLVRYAGALWLGAMLTACGRADAGPPESGVSAGVVDSTMSRAEALRRFRQNLPTTDRLESGAGSRDQLVESFVRALAASDTAALAQLAVTRSEFGYLYYPTSPQGFPPYDVEPGLMWFLLFERSDLGIRRALRSYGGQPMQLLGYDCGDRASNEGENTIWGPCIVRWRDGKNQVRSERLFSQIIGRDGQFKFLSYANKL
ncbi:MAG: hypothetical protein H0T90_01500 [Gemmatimonadales bacterium]|nr:hypothetical protein [Gemmatimonadales bacterium]